MDMTVQAPCMCQRGRDVGAWTQAGWGCCRKEWDRPRAGAEAVGGQEGAICFPHAYICHPLILSVAHRAGAVAPPVLQMSMLRPRKVRQKKDVEIVQVSSLSHRNPPAQASGWPAQLLPSLAPSHAPNFLRSAAGDGVVQGSEAPGTRKSGGPGQALNLHGNNTNTGWWAGWRGGLGPHLSYSHCQSEALL